MMGRDKQVKTRVLVHYCDKLKTWYIYPLAVKHVESQVE